MVIAPFRVPAPRRVSTRVALVPVYNALTSLALLNAAEQVQDVDVWVHETAARLTPDQRHANRLVFEGLGEALITDEEWPDFPAFVEHLASLSPQSVRDQLIARLARPASSTRERAADNGSPSPKDLLTERQTFLQQLERLYPAEPLDEVLYAEVHALLTDPPALHDVLVSHLRGMWVSYLADEWQRRLPFLMSIVAALRDREWPATATEAIRAFIGRDVPPAINAQLDGVEHIVFSISPHVGPYASRFGSDNTLWLFVRGRSQRDDPTQRPTLDLPLRQTPIKRVELVGPFSALADETRLQILELLAQGELLAQEIIARLGLSQSSVSRHLKQLISAGFLLERRGEGANKLYRLNEARIDWTYLSLRQLLSGASSEARIEQNTQPPELRRFLDVEGKIVDWPARRKDQVLILQYLAEQFEPGRQYSEKAVNRLLDERIAKRRKSGAPIRGVEGPIDFVTLRRELFEEHLLHRTNDGARYWRPGDPVS